MLNLRMLAVAIVVLPLTVGSGCMVSQKKFDAEHQKAADLQQDLDKANASLKTTADESKARTDEFAKLKDDLAQTKAKAADDLKKERDTYQAQVKLFQAAAAKADQTIKQQVAALAEKNKKVEELTAQWKDAQDKVLKLTEELRKPPAPPPEPAK